MNRAAKVLLILLSAVFFLSAQFNASVAQDLNKGSAAHNYAKAKVLEVETYEFGGPEGDFRYSQIMQKAVIEMLSGKFRNKKVHIDHMATGMMGPDMILKPGDRVLVFVDERPSEEESPDGEPLFFIADYARNVPIAWLAALYCILLIAVAGIKGLRSLASLLITIGMLFFVMFPLVLRGFNPLLVSVLIVGIVSALAFRIIAGRSIKSLSAALGTFSGVAIAGILAMFVGKIVRLSGLSSQESKMLLYSMDIRIDFQGLLFGAILIGALGAIMDIGMSIASAVDEVKKHKPDADLLTLFKSGMNVGGDVIGTMSNTLILAYTGSSLPLLLLLIANNVPVSKITNMELIAVEIVRALAGSSGLVLCIPITAAVAAFLHSGASKKEKP